MRILWFCNVVLPAVAEAAGLKEKVHSAGWIEGFLAGLSKARDIELGIISPASKTCHGEFGGGRYWLCSSTDEYAAVLNDFDPDILHVFGTELPAGNALIKAFGKPQRTVVNIQGMAHLCGEVYLNGLPPKLQLKQRFFEKYIHSGLLSQRDDMLRRGVTEADTMRRVQHAIGRTDIDRMFATDLNPQIHYHRCNEILRKEFYNGETWDIEKIERHSILFRNTNNPIKGLYQMLCAMPYILERYPNAHLYVVGETFKFPKGIKRKLLESSFNRLLRETAQKLNIANHITALGTLDPVQMKKRYLKSHVFVSASIIENESNVVSEAKILGVPVVASFVGGLPNRIQHGYDGYLYPFNMPQTLAYYVKRVFENDEQAVRLSQNAQQTQSVINDPTTNINTLLEIYERILAEWRVSRKFG